MIRYKILRADRAARDIDPSATFYRGNDYYGLCEDDQRMTGIEHVAICDNKSGYPFVTIPREDVEEIR